ncbi:MAG TPA: mandelate racemase/muconate lactonizing enzyme family protein [Bauldia sp.]|nr:mandelate racemase/muconate lactonizing enzyme family protein [Bauldia sp.]
MKIASVEAIPLVAPLDEESQRTALGGRPNAALVLVVIKTDDGIVGYGEALARYSLRSYVSIIEDLLAPIVIGQDPFEVERLWQKMSHVFTGKISGLLLEAVAAVDIALWDIMGKSVGLPVHRLLGSMGRDRIKVYASSISWGADKTAKAQTEAAVRQGFPMIKIKIGPTVEKALARARFVREIAGPEIQLCADGNCAFDFDDALAVARGLHELGFYWFEEPVIVEDIEAYHRLRLQSPIRIASGESEHTVFGCRDIIARGSVGVIQPDVARSGGITETRRIAALGYAFGVPFAPHVGFSGAVCVAASLQLCAAAPNFLTFECMTFPNPLREELATLNLGDPDKLIDGCVALPSGPGLGIEIPARNIERFRAR